MPKGPHTTSPHEHKAFLKLFHAVFSQALSQYYKPPVLVLRTILIQQVTLLQG